MIGRRCDGGSATCLLGNPVADTVGGAVIVVAVAALAGFGFWWVGAVGACLIPALFWTTLRPFPFLRRGIAGAAGLLLLPAALFLAGLALWVDSGVAPVLRPVCLALAVGPLAIWAAMLRGAFSVRKVGRRL